MRGAFADELPPERPRTPDASYGVPTTGGSMIGWSECIERIRTADGYWLATVRPDKSPHVVPVWGVVVDDDLQTLLTSDGPLSPGHWPVGES